MKKVLLLTVLFLLVGCSRKIVNLSDKYYHNGDYIEVESTELNNNETYILYTYNNFCNLPIPCENVFKEVLEKYHIDALSMPFDEFKNTVYHKEVKYAPSILIIDKGDLITYLDANSDSDYEKYQDTTKFEEWLKEYIYLEKTAN